MVYYVYSAVLRSTTIVSLALSTLALVLVAAPFFLVQVLLHPALDLEQALVLPVALTAVAEAAALDLQQVLPAAALEQALPVDAFAWLTVEAVLAVLDLVQAVLDFVQVLVAAVFSPLADLE